MRAITVLPGTANSARLDDVPDPPPADGAILVRTWALGVCGTDREILSGAYGESPPGEQRLVLGHESLGEVIEAPEGCGVARGDLVVGIVRRPDPVPCPAAFSPRPGTTPSASGGARAPGSRRPCSSPAPARSGCWRR